jgi:GNAT superfamily N-acetyltransferase
METLMRASIRDIFPAFYDAEQTVSSMRYVAVPDLNLIRDGTYFALDAGADIVACGGWSRRGRLYTGSGHAAGDDRLLDPSREAAHVRAMFVRSDWTRRGLGRRILKACEAAAWAQGFRRLDLMGTLPGIQLYAAYGFRELRRTQVELPDGVRLECAEMEMPLPSNEF